MANDRSRATPRMPHRGVVGAAALLLAASALAGCAPTPEPSPTSTPTAIFASEEEALAAATDVYQQYTAAKDEEASRGDASTDSLVPLVTPEYLEELKVVGALEKNGWHTEGTTTFDTVTLQTLSEHGGFATVSIYLCRDVSRVRILDSQGIDVTPATRLDRFPLSVELISSAVGSQSLLIADSGSWPDENFC